MFLVLHVVSGLAQSSDVGGVFWLVARKVAQDDVLTLGTAEAGIVLENWSGVGAGA